MQLRRSREPEFKIELPETPPDGDYERGYDEARDVVAQLNSALNMRARWVTWITRATAGVAFAGLIVIVSAVAVVCVVVPLAHTITQLANGKAPVSVASKQARAEDRWIHCFTMKDDLELPDTTEKERADAAQVCDGYSTLEEAYASQGVDPPG